MRTILLNLPLKCRGYVYEDMETGEKCCVLNARLTHEANVKTYEHETEHVKHNDLEENADVNAIETLRH